MEKTMEKIVALAKARGFVYPGSEIYGGLANTWDYGNLGVELKNNVKKAWWQKFVQESPYNVGVDCAILMNPQTWVASGHLGGFSDPLMDCKDCHERFRADKLIEDINCNDEDVCFLPGGPGHKTYYDCDKLIDMLKVHNEAGGRIAAICAAPSVLGKLGFLKGKRATAFPGFEDMLEGAEVAPKTERVVTDGNITTSRGMGTSVDLGLELVTLIKGKELADELAVSTQYIND